MIVIKAKLLIFCSVLFILLASQIVFAAGEHSLSIFVYDEVPQTTVANITVYNATDTWTCTNCDSYNSAPNFIIGTLWDGTYTVNVSKFGYDDYSSDIFIDRDRLMSVFLNMETESPQYLNCLPPNETHVTYSPGVDYDFRCDWTDNVNIHDVVMEFASIIYHSLTGEITRTGDVFNITFNDLGAGTYNYNWSANDTAGNSNQTGLLQFFIDQANINVNLLLNNQPQDLYVDYQDPVNATAWSDAGTVNLFRDDQPIDLENGIEITYLDANENPGYLYKANATGDTNYTDNDIGVSYRVFVMRDDPVDPVDPLMFLTLNDQESDVTITYNDQSNATGWRTFTEGDITLYRNISGTPTEVNAENNTWITLPVGVWEYTLDFPGSTNYNAGSITRILTINPADPGLVLDITPLNPDYGTLTTATCTHSNPEPGAVITLYRNVSGVLTDVTATENNTALVLPGGDHQYVCNITATENYTADELTQIYTVNPIVATITLFYETFEWLVDANEQAPYTPDINATINIPSLQPQVVLNLFENGNPVPVSNPDTAVKGVGVYEYNATFAGNENYTAFVTPTRTLIVSLTPTLMTLLLDGIDGDNTYERGDIANLTAILDVTVAEDMTIYLDGTPLGSGQSPYEYLFDTIGLAVGPHEVKANWTGNADYDPSQSTHILNIQDTVPPILTITNPVAGTNTTPTVWLNATTNENTICYFGPNPSPTTQMNNTNAMQHSELLTGLPYGTNTYYVNCTDGANTVEESVTWTVAESFDIELETGWNLISLSIIPFDPVMADDVSIWGPGEYYIEHFNSTSQTWMTYNSTTDLTNFEILPDWGYWVWVDSNRTINLFGSDPGQRTVHLVTGINMVGWTNQNPTDMELALWYIVENVTDVQCQNMTDISIQLLRQCYPPAGENFEPGKGYFINVTNETNWTYILDTPPIADAGPNKNIHNFEKTTFSGNSRDLDGVIVSYLWDFGDGDTSTQTTPEHYYTEFGIYTVNLTVTDDDGLTGWDTAIVTVDSGGGGGGGTSRRAELTVTSPDEITITQGESDTVTFTVENTGQVVVNDINFNVNGIDADLSETSIDSLDVGDSITIEATINVPDNEEVGETTINFIARGEGSYQGDLLRTSDSSSTTLIVEAGVTPTTPGGEEGPTGPAGLITGITENAPLVGAIILILALAGIAYYGNKKGWFKKIKLPKLPKAKDIKKSEVKSVSNPEPAKEVAKKQDPVKKQEKGDGSFSFSTNY